MRSTLARAALCEAQGADFVARTALCEPPRADVAAGAIQNALREIADERNAVFFNIKGLGSFSDHSRIMLGIVPPLWLEFSLVS